MASGLTLMQGSGGGGAGTWSCGWLRVRSRQQDEERDEEKCGERRGGASRPRQPLTGPSLCWLGETRLASQGKSGRLVGVAALGQQGFEARVSGRDPAIRCAPVRGDGTAAVACLFQDLAKSKCGPGVTQLVGHRKRRPGGLEIVTFEVQKTELVCGFLIPAFGRNAICVDQAARVAALREKAAQ
jgi:hypothetical protein